MDPQSLIASRGRLLAVALERFASDPDIVGVFLGGSVAAGTADAYSDIDLRVVVKPEKYADFVARRREIPTEWPGFLFNECMPGAQHCVSHFQPFGKIDVFYLTADALKPSPWYTLPIKILHDPSGLIAALLTQSKALEFTTSVEDIEHSISKGLAAAHEAYRRAKRGEFLYAQTLLDEVRHHIMKADDLLFGRTPYTAVHAKFDKRGSPEVIEALAASFCGYVGPEIEAALGRLVQLYQRQVIALHKKFPLMRPLESDLGALDVIS